jgi:hypothetical protein
MSLAEGVPTEEATCPKCEGRGTVIDPTALGNPERRCPRCHGTGLIERAVPPRAAAEAKVAAAHLERAKAGIESSHQIARNAGPGTQDWEIALMGIEAAKANALIAIAELLQGKA